MSARPFCLVATAAALLNICAVAPARPSARNVFQQHDRTALLTDRELSQVRGGYGERTGSGRSFRTILDSQSFAERQAFGSIGGVLMDNWWSDVGAQLILTSATTPR